MTPAGLEIRGVTSALLDDGLDLRARGGGPGEGLTWRARLRDDDARVWRAAADRAAELPERWAPAKAGPGAAIASLQSLRPVSIDVRVESDDGRSAQRTVTRLIVADGVRLRRWRGDITGALCLPADLEPRAALVIDATARAPQAAVATLAAPLLASRGILTLAVTGGPPGAAAVAAERLAAVPGAGDDIRTLQSCDPAGDAVEGVVLPPGVGVRGEGDATRAAARAIAWDALLAALGARPRDDSG